MIRYFSVIILIITLSCSCNSDDDGGVDTSGDPSGLTMEIDVATDGSGIVVVTANASNVIQYEFYMGDGNPNEPYPNTTGVYEHTYESLGSYKVEVRAYGSSGRFIKQEQQIAVVTGETGTVGEGYTTPTSYPGMQLVWNDEFDGNVLNSDYWTHEIGNGTDGWGNQELQYYRAQNTSVGGGFLTIEAREEAFDGYNYTSSRIISKGKQFFKYGRVDIRAVLPQGQGMWPALWMLGENISTVSWPACGEIDIMELVGGNDRNNKVYGTLHWDSNGHADDGGNYSLSSGIFADEFHVFSIIWDESRVQWFVDDNHYFTLNTTNDDMSEFHKNFFFIMNIAVGGEWPGSPNATTTFPQQMLVDYIRVFQDN